MTILNNVLGADYTAVSLRTILPVSIGCLGFFYPSAQTAVGAGASATLTDFSPVGMPATLTIVPPVLNSGYMAINHAPTTNQFAQTGIIDPGTDFSIVVVSQDTDINTSNVTRPIFVSNFGGDSVGQAVSSGTKYIEIAASSSAPLISFTDTYNGSTAPTYSAAQTASSLTLINPTGWHAYALTVQTISGVTTRTAYNLTDNTSAVASVTSARLWNAQQKFILGGQRNTNAIGGLANCAHASFYNVALSVTQLTGLAGVLPFLRLRLNNRGVVGF